MARTCGTCGATVGVLQDQCPACGADPDIRLIEVGGLGPRRRPDPDAPSGDGPGIRSWLPFVAVLAVVALLAIVTGSGGTEEDDAAAPETTEPRPTTIPPRVGRTTTTTEASEDQLPQVPVLGEPTGLMLAVLSEGGDVIDLDTGERWRLRDQLLGGYAGRLLVNDNGHLAWWPRPYDGSGAVPFDAQENVQQAWVDRDGRVWAVVYVDDHTQLVVFTVDGAVGARLDLPPQAYPLGMLGGEMAVGGPGGTYAIDEGGDARRISSGQAMAVAGDRALVMECDDTLTCEVVAVDAAGDELEGPTIDPALFNSGMISISPTGHVAAVDYRAESRLVVDGIDVDIGDHQMIQGLAWTPDGRWLIAALERDVFVLDTATGVTSRPELGGSIVGYQVFVFGAA